MNNKVCYIRPEQALDECMALFTDKRMHHLPVLDEKKSVGIVSIGDAVKQYIADKEFTIQQLENYITSSI
jgi:CBS-domain-containing membrane protein